MDVHKPTYQDIEQACYDRSISTLHRTHQANAVAVVDHWKTRANEVGVNLPSVDPSIVDDIDYSQVKFWSELANQGELSLPDTVRIYRGQTSDDTRPNKDLYELTPPAHPEMISTCHQWNAIVRHGVIPKWSPTKPRLQSTRPANHNSINGHGYNIRRHLRKGQLEGRYLIVDANLLERWPEIFISPLAVVEKPGGVNVDIRLINDYSFPSDASVNDYTDRSEHPPISYNPPKAIARRIHQLKQLNPATSVLLMLGDVAGAFRHVPIHADAVHMFSFLYEDLLVIDLSSGFGWCGSPSYYSLAGKLINYSYEFGNQLTQQFSGSVWCDDHTCVGLDEGNRCFDANIALRRAMASVLGPTAINELKFTSWSTVVKALGLLWDTESGCVLIPADKINKAVQRISNLLGARSITKTAVLKTIGSLRHVASCSRPARAFFQRLQFTANSLPKFGQRQLPADARDDLHWFLTVLQNPVKFNSIPVAQFADLSEPAVHVFMDASGQGLCALEPNFKRYIRQRFSHEESKTLSINVRELRSAVLAVLHWGPHWHSPTSTSPLHVQFHIDNTSAVTWANKRASKHPTAQLYNRLLSLAEFQYNLVCTATHIPGKLNVMADAGSRAWSSNDQAAKLWTNFSAPWLQDHIEPPFDDLSAVWDRCYSDTPWQALPIPNISRIGVNGAYSRTKWGWSRWLNEKNSSRRLGYFATVSWAHGANRYQRGNQLGTINLKLASVKWFHRRYKDLTLPATPRLAMLLQGIKRLSSPKRKKQPLTMPFLRLLRRSLDFSKPRQRPLWGSILIGFFFMLRRSEYLMIDHTRHFYCLKNSNAFFSDKDGQKVGYTRATSVTIGLEGAKNDQYGRGAWRTMHASGDAEVCPIRGLYHIQKARQELNLQHEPHLCGNLSAGTVSRALKRTARRAGVSAKDYASHSIRIGGATALVAGGADRLSIKLLGRWASNCFEEYPRQSAQASLGLSNRMVQRRESTTCRAH